MTTTPHDRGFGVRSRTAVHMCTQNFPFSVQFEEYGNARPDRIPERQPPAIVLNLLSVL